MKKLMALLLALALSFSLVACGKNAEKEDPKEEPKKASDNAESEATAVAEGFLDALVDLDTKKAAKYIDDEDAIPDFAGQYDNALEEMMSTMPAELESFRGDVEERMDTIMNKIIAKAKDAMAYEIVETEKDGENYVFTVELTAPDEDSDPFSDIDAEGFLMEQVTEWYEDGIITDSSTEEDLFELLIPAIFDFMEDAIDDVEVETVSDTVELVVVPDGDGWIISAEESGL